MKVKHILCAVMAALAVGAAMIPCVRVSAVPAGLANPNGAEKDGVYRLSRMISEETGVWEYYWFNTKQEYAPMEYNPETKGWQGVSPATTAIITSQTWHTYTQGYTVARFTCPESGRVRIGTETAVALSNLPNAKDGVIFIVMSDGEPLGESLLVTPQNPSQEFETVETDVYKGQEIEFFLYMNINNAGDSTTVTPFVEYTVYKDVAAKEKTAADTKKEELVLRTDIDPIGVEEPVFEFRPIALLIGALPVLVIGVAVMIVLLKRREGK